MVFFRGPGGTEYENLDMKKQEENLSVFESLGNMTDDAVEQQSRKTAGFTL